VLQAILGGIVQSEFAPAAHVHIYDVNEPRMAHYQSKWPDMVPHTDPAEAVRGADLCLLAVKPQHMAAACERLAPAVDSNTLVLSIAAGCTLKQIGRQLPNSRSIVRVMPNTPAMISQGMSVWCGTSHVNEQQVELCRRLISCFGKEHFVEDESYLDIATAVVGSGPAYTFLFIEAQIDTAVHMGFPRDVAEKLVLETVRGSTAYFEDAQAHVAKLRNDITSPGGTTAAALYELDRLGFKHTIADALWASHRRSLELGGKDSDVGPGRSKTPQVRLGTLIKSPSSCYPRPDIIP